MTDKQIIIDDQNKIINILEQECTEKMDIIVALENKLKAKEQECEELKDKIDNIRDFAKQGRDIFVEQGSFADWYKIAEFMKNHFNFILYEIDNEE